MNEKEEHCQQELETYRSFNETLNHASSLAHETQTANYVATPKFKETFDSLMVKMMKAESGDELSENHKNYKALLDKEHEDGHITTDIHKALMAPADNIKSQRETYLSKPFDQLNSWKKNAWIVTGIAVISTALALTVVGVPLIPAAVLGGAALAYGGIDQAHELYEHSEETSSEALASMHNHKFDAFKQQLDNSDIPKAAIPNVKDYLEPAQNNEPEAKVKQEGLIKRSLKKMSSIMGLPKLFSKETPTRERIKLAGKALGIAGLALAVVAMAAVFPPVGIPLAAGIGIGIASTAVIAGAGAVVAIEHNEAKKEYKQLALAHKDVLNDLSQNLNDTFSESSQQTQSKRVKAEGSLITHNETAPPISPLKQAKKQALEDAPNPGLNVTSPKAKPPLAEPSIDLADGQGEPSSPRGITELKEAVETLHEQGVDALSNIPVPLNGDIETFAKETSHSVADTSNMFNELNSAMKGKSLNDVIHSTTEHKPLIDATIDDDAEEEEQEGEGGMRPQ